MEQESLQLTVTYIIKYGQKIFSVSIPADGELQTVTLPRGVFSRDAIISAIVRLRYPEDRMEAVINNYLLNQEDNEASEEFADMQNWRKFAKNKADEAMAYAMEHGMISQPEQEE